MNKVLLVGRMVRDPEIRYTNEGTSIAKFSIAVDRAVKKDSEQQTADFPSCVAFGKTAEFIEKYFRKGNRIGIVGRIQTGNYTDKDGKKIYTTDVVAENVEFVESRAAASAEPAKKEVSNDFVQVPDDVGDEGLPFN